MLLSDETGSPDTDFLELGESPAPAELHLEELPDLGNIAHILEEGKIASLVQEAMEGYEIDKQSRAEWEQAVERAIKLISTAKEAKTFPWEGAANAKYPLITTAVNGFAARAMPAIVKQGEIVKGATYGGDPEGKKASRSKRVGEHMTYQLNEEVENWITDMDKLMHSIPLCGTAFKKVFWDDGDKPGVDFVPALDLVVNQNTRTLDTCPRTTQILRRYPHEYTENIRKGIWSDVSKAITEDTSDKHAERVVLEIHTRFDLDDDGYDEPYIITIDKESRECLRLQASFDAKDVERDEEGEVTRIKGLKYFVDYHFIPDPSGKFYSLGFATLLDTPQEIVNSLLNQLLDAGTLANTPMTFLAGGIARAFKKSEFTFSPGQMRSVPASGDDLRKQIVTHSFPEASGTLFSLMEFMLNSGKELGMIADVLSGEAPAQEAAAKTLARIEQALQPFNAVYERIYRAMKKEFKCLFALNSAFLPPEKYHKFTDPEDEMQQVPGPDGQPVEQPVPVDPQTLFLDYTQGDCDIVPISSPGQVTKMQRMAAAEALKDYLDRPDVNNREILKRIFEAMEADDVQKILTPPEPDPMMIRGQEAEVAEKEAKALRELAIALKNASEAARPSPMPMDGTAFVPDLYKIATELAILAEGADESLRPDPGGVINMLPGQNEPPAPRGPSAS
jgi:chaperonin GroES